MIYDFIIIGGGILGASSAWQLIQRYPGKKILLLEKESNFARHQTGRNSGVIHAGVYYQPGSLKAEFCKKGVDETINFCREQHIPYEQCGKLLVATSEVELERMHSLFARCQENEIDCTLVSKDKLVQLEPNISGLGAIHVMTTGIVNYSEITEKMISLFITMGGEVKQNTEVTGLSENDQCISVSTRANEYRANHLVSCSGLMADRLVKLHGINPGFRIIPFRGEYYRLADDKNKIISHLIYPIPDPDLPFLGVHLTRMIDGSITVGPNALLGLKREGYGKLNISLKDIVDMITFPGFRKIIKKHYRYGLNELKNSLNKKGYLRAVQKYCPQLTINDLQPYPAGVRAQAVLTDGTLVHDFLFEETARSIHVCNAPSPAATSAIPIGNYICDKLVAKTAA